MAITNNVSISGTGLFGSETRQSYFLRAGPSYSPNRDPRLPSYTKLVSNLDVNTTEITVEDIGLLPVPTEVYANATVTSNTALSSLLTLPVTTLANIIVGTSIITANIPASANIKVNRIFANNNTIRLGTFRSNVQITEGELIDFRPTDVVGSIRVGTEVIFYQKLWVANSTLTGLTRTVANTPPAGTLLAGNLVSILGLRTVSS
jgi:hypothetical protein